MTTEDPYDYDTDWGIDEMYADRPAAIRKIILNEDYEDGGKLLNEVKEEFGEDSWKEKLIRMAADEYGSVTDSLWGFTEKELQQSDILMLSSVLADPIISQSYNRTIKDNLMAKLIQFSNDPGSVDDTEVTENLKTALSGIRDCVSKRDTVESAVETDMTDLFNAAKTLLLYSPKNTEYVMEMMGKYKNVFTKNIYDQLMDVIVKVNQEQFDTVRQINYKPKEFVPEEDEEFYGAGLYWMELPPREDSVLEMESSIGNANESLVGAKETASLTRSIFEKDMNYMRQQLVKNGGGEVHFRALIVRNPANEDDPPLLLIRPNTAFNFGRKYLNGDGSDEFHQDIWDGWVISAYENPDSDRRKVVNQVLSAGGYRELEHLYMKLSGGEDDSTHLEITSGWSAFSDEEDSESLLKKMSFYGVDSVAMGSVEEDKVLLEKMILEDEMQFLITTNAEKLSRIVPPKSVSRYKTLARKFLADPNSNKESRAYMTFMEYNDLLGKI